MAKKFMGVEIRIVPCEHKNVIYVTDFIPEPKKYLKCQDCGCVVKDKSIEPGKN